jgi:hypothetical protein
MKRKHSKSSQPARPIKRFLSELVDASKRGRESGLPWDAKKILDYVSPDYDICIPAGLTRRSDRALVAVENVVLKKLVDEVEGENDRVMVRGMVLLWGYYFGKIGRRTHVGVSAVAGYFLKKEKAAASQEEIFPRVDGFLRDVLTPFLKHRRRYIANPEISIPIENFKKALYQAFGKVDQTGQDRCVNFARDAITKIILSSNPELLSEDARKSIPEETASLAEIINKTAASEEPVRVDTMSSLPPSPVVSPVRGVPEEEKLNHKSVHSEVPTQATDEPERQYYETFLEARSNSLPDAYSRKIPLKFFVDKTVLVEDPSGHIDHLTVTELLARMIGRSGVIVGECGIGITSIIRKTLNLSMPLWREEGKVLIGLSAEKLRPAANIPHLLYDILLDEIKSTLPKDVFAAIKLRDSIKALDDSECATFIIDDADKLESDALEALLGSMAGKNSVFFTARTWQADLVLNYMKDKQPLKITIPFWTSDECDELSGRLFGLMPDGSCDRRSFDLRLSEFPELKRYPLGILACFEQTIKNDNVIPVVIQRWITELAGRVGIPVPGLLTTEDIGENSRYLMAVGGAFLAAINSNALGAKVPVDYDLSTIDIMESVINGSLIKTKDQAILKVREKVKRRFLDPTKDGAVLRSPNQIFSIYFGGLAWANRTAGIIDKLIKIYKRDDTSLGRIRMMEQSIWEYRNAGYSGWIRNKSPL